MRSRMWRGDWHGTLTVPTGQLRLLLTIRQSEGGALTAELESPDQAPGAKIPVPTIAARRRTNDLLHPRDQRYL